MKHHNRQEELQFHRSQEADLHSYMSDCIFHVVISISTYFKINLAFICFILHLQINLTVLQCPNHYEASLPSRRATNPSKPVARDAVLYVRL